MFSAGKEINTQDVYYSINYNKTSIDQQEIKCVFSHTYKKDYLYKM